MGIFQTLRMLRFRNLPERTPVAEQIPAETETNPTLSDVFSALADAVGPDESPGERIQIDRQNPRLYVCRVYPGAGEDYEGYIVSLEDGS
jgi:hypothetical protein